MRLAIPDAAPLLLCFIGVGIVTDYTTLAEVYWMRDAGYTVEEITFFQNIVNVSWLFRPFFGLVIDRMESLELALIATSFVTGLLWIWLALSVDQTALSIFLLIVSEFGPAISLTITDSMMVKYSRHHRNWMIPQWCQVVRQLGKAVAGYVGSTQIPYGYRNMYMQQAILLCVFANLLLAIELRRGCRKKAIVSPEDGVGGNGEGKVTSRAVKKAEEDAKLHRAFTIYLFVSSLMPSSASAIFLFLSGPMQFPSTTFGLLEFTDLVSVFGSCFTMTSFTISSLSYTISLSLAISNILLLGIIVRQDVVDDGLILVIASIWVTFITSIVHTRFTVETSKVAPRGKEAYFYALHSTIPGFGRFLSAFLTMALTAYYRINHDNFEKLTLFHGSCSIFQSLSLFLALYM